MNESILTSIKKMLGIEEDYEYYDADITTHINAVFLILAQLGVGPSEGFAIVDKSQTWEEFIAEAEKLGTVKSYMYLKVRLLFDPPVNGTTVESMKSMISEYESRLALAFSTQTT